jgi:predicted phage terminase large subunit-like protein
MTRREKIEYLAALKERAIRNSRTSLLHFTAYTMPTFEPVDFHRHYYNVLTKFADGKIKKLMVFVPPQHGKSEGSTRRLPPYMLGKNPNLRLAVVSYSAPKARKFNREIQRVIDTPEYHEIFPDTCLNSSNVTTVAGSWLRNADECEIVGHRGGFKTVGVGGPLTGDPVDVLIMDDIYKDAKSAWSPTVRESIEDWYDTVAETRLHNNSQQLIVFTRWHEHDLAGKLIEEQGIYDPVTNPRGWVIVKYEAIKVGKPTEYDPREEGEALWPERHNLEKLESVRSRNPHVFDSLYQQDPKPVEGLMYERGFRTYDAIPHSKTMRKKAYIDTADTGEDYLCAICYVETETANYVTDILYTQKPMEFTEPKTAEMLCRQGIDEAIVESNNGGRGFARAVENQCRIMGNDLTSFTWFSQTENKQVRIFSHSAEVQNLVYFPTGWDRMWPDFYRHVTTYMKVGKNDHDDAEDCLTGTVEQRNRNGMSASELAGLF